MKKINHISWCLMMVLLVLAIASCKRNDGYNIAPISTDQTKPGVVTNVKVDNFSGGSFITYDLPNSDNILYVLAKYTIRNGVSRETKASYYIDTVRVEGFAKSDDYDVTLYTVSRANVMSDAVTVKVHPEEPGYLKVKPTVVISPDFGGINIKAFNPDKSEVGLILSTYNPTLQEDEVIDQHFSKTDSIDYAIRGYEAEPKTFKIFVTDKFGNVSDTVITTVTPLYEELLDKTKFTPYVLPSDSEIGYGWSLSNLWNGSIDGAGWHTNPGQPAPYVATWDVSKVYKLSRFILWERSNDGSTQYAFNHGNPKVFSLWGSDKSHPADAKLPVSAPVGAVVGDWTNLGNYTYPNPPSGAAPGSVTSADNDFVRAGVNFNVPFNSPSARFFRLAVSRSWSGGAFAHAMEISLYGKPE